MSSFSVFLFRISKCWVHFFREYGIWRRGFGLHGAMHRGSLLARDAEYAGKWLFNISAHGASGDETVDLCWLRQKQSWPVWEGKEDLQLHMQQKASVPPWSSIVSSCLSQRSLSPLPATGFSKKLVGKSPKSFNPRRCMEYCMRCSYRMMVMAMYSNSMSFHNRNRQKEYLL